MKYDTELKKSLAKFNRLKTIATREIAFLKAELKQLGEFVKLYARRANEEMKAQVSKIKAFLEDFTDQTIKNEVQISETKDDQLKLQTEIINKNRQIDTLRSQLSDRETNESASLQSQREALNKQKSEFKRMIALLKQEMQQRYTKQFVSLKENVKALQDNFNMQMN